MTVITIKIMISVNNYENETKNGKNDSSYNNRIENKRNKNQRKNKVTSKPRNAQTKRRRQDRTGGRMIRSTNHSSHE